MASATDDPGHRQTKNEASESARTQSAGSIDSSNANTVINESIFEEGELRTRPAQSNLQRVGSRTYSVQDLDLSDENLVELIRTLSRRTARGTAKDGQMKNPLDIDDPNFNLEEFLRSFLAKNDEEDGPGMSSRVRRIYLEFCQDFSDLCRPPLASIMSL